MPGGGHVEADLETDFWAGPATPSSNWLRIRRAGISLDWTNTTVFFGQDKPLISPYQPTSFAEVGVPPLAGAGNLWFWLPQARVDQTFHLGSNNGVDVQVGILQEGSYLYDGIPSSTTYLSGVRPALEARVAFWHKSGDSKKWELGTGFHISSNHVYGTDVTSRIGSVDWLYNPLRKLQITGTAYYGQNVASLGSLGNGFYLTDQGNIRPVVSAGGWAQLSAPLNNRITLNLFGGVENDQAGDFYGSGIARADSLAGNIMFHLAPNVVTSLEAQRLWTRSFAGQPDNYNHYDLALAYLF